MARGYEKLDLSNNLTSDFDLPYYNENTEKIETPKFKSC